MDEEKAISSNKDSGDVTSQGLGLGEDFDCVDETRRCAIEYFVNAMDLLQLSKVECARRSLQSGHIYLLALTQESFYNPTEYEKEQVRRGKEMSLWCVSGPPFCGVILIDQMDSDQDDQLYIHFTIAFAALALKLHEHNMAIEVFKLAMNSNGTDSPPHREINVDFEFSVAVAKANIGCVYLILGHLEKARESLECALKCLERFKLEKNVVTLEVDIFAVENNLSLVLQGQQNYAAAVKLQNDLVSRAKHLTLPFRMVAAMHYNRADLSLELEDPAKALKELQELKSLSEILDDENGIPEEFISSKICLVYLLMKEVALAEEIAVKSSLSPWFSLFLPSISSSWLPSSSSLSSSSLSSSSLSTSTSSSSSSLSSSSSSSPPSSPPPSSSEFEVFPKSNGKLPWDFSVGTIANLVDFRLHQENVQPVSTILDLCVSNCKEMFGKRHPTFASLLYRQGVKFSLTGQNVSSKKCLEEALSIYTRSGFAFTHPEVSKCNAALARLILCESFQEENVLSSQSIARTPSDSDEHCRKSQEFIFSDSIASSSLFEKFVKQIIKSEEKFGEISELVMTSNLLKIQGPSVGQITVWLHDESIKMNIQPTHGKKNLAINNDESLSCDRVDINEVLVEEMKMCASSLGVPFETYTERSSCPSPLQILGAPLMNPTQTPNVKAMTGASSNSQNYFDDEESSVSAQKNQNASLQLRKMKDQTSIPVEEFNFSTQDQKNDDEICAIIAPSCSFSKVEENKGKEDPDLLPIKDFSQYRDVTRTTDKSRDTEELHTKANTKRNAASDQSRHESWCSPVTVKADNGQTSTNRPQRVIGTHEDPSVKPCVVDDRLENVADDVTDCVVTYQDHNEEPERKLHPSNQESRGNGKVVKIDRSPKQYGLKGMGFSRNKEERRSFYENENDANNSFCRGEDVVADNGDRNDSVEVHGACGYQNDWCLQDANTPREGKVDSDRGSKKKRKEPLGLKGGRRDEFSSNGSSLGAANIPCTSESSHLGIKSGFLVRQGNDNSMSCSMDETEGRLNCTNFCQFPDCTECFSRDTATASITALKSPAQSSHNFNSYQPEQYRSPENEEIRSPPPPPQFSSLPYDVRQERHYMSENDFDIGTVQSRTRHSIDSNTNLFSQASLNSSTWLEGFTNPENGIGLGGQNTGINQREIGRSAFSARSTSTTPNFISEQAETTMVSERAMRQQERKRIERETSTERVLTDGVSTTVQPSLPNSNSGTTSDDDNSLAGLERRVAEACSLAERVLKEKEDKTIKERVRTPREERILRELQEEARSLREARKTKKEQRAAPPENPQWLCEHYQRLCRVKFPCCGRFYPCHRCHNNSDDCQNDNCKAKEAFYIECSVCGHQQAINRDAHTCARCKTRMSAYFCSICKHFTGEDKHPYHCTKCGICRIYKDRSFHCDVCNVCLDKRLQGKHTCRPDSGHDECCICLEDAFSGCQILPCSHKVHRECAIVMIHNGVRRCPVCDYPLYRQPPGTE